MNLFKICILLISISLPLKNAFSQAEEELKSQTVTTSKESKSVLILNVGVGFPTGNYADSENGGAAKSGLGIGVEFQYKINESFYFGAMFRNQSNKIDKAAMKRSIASSLQPGIGVSSLSAENWKLNSYLFGIGTISQINNDEISFYTKMMLGLCSAESPSIQTTLTDGSGEVTINQLSGTADNFAALFGIGFRIHAGESVDILISGDYFTSTLEFEDILVNAQGQGTVSTPPLEQEAEIISISVGLVFKL